MQKSEVFINGELFGTIKWRILYGTRADRRAKRAKFLKNGKHGLKRLGKARGARKHPK